MVEGLLAAVSEDFDDPSVGLQAYAQHGIPLTFKTRPEA
jgi:hypothetical protein